MESSAQYPADGTARCGLQLSVRRAYSAHRGQLPCRSAASRYDLPVYPESGGLLQQSSDRNLFPHDTLPVHSGQSPTPSGIFTSLRLLSRDYCLAAAHTRQRSVTLPPFFYVLAVEFLLDLFKYSAALSSSRVSGALSIVGGLLIGDIAVSLNWASTEVLFYAAVTMLANLSLSSIEFADALRIYRILLVVTTGLWGLPGFLIGLTLVTVSILTTPTFAGFSYFWPLFPFNGPALRSLLFRRPTYKAQPSKVWSRGHVHHT